MRTDPLSRFGCVLFLLIALPLTGCGQKSEKTSESKPKMDMHRVQAGEIGADGWCEAESTGGHFRAKFPARYNDFTVSGSDTNGTQVVTYVIGTVAEDNTKYTVSLIVKDEFKQKRSDENFADGVLEAMKKNGKLEESRSFLFQGQPCKEAKFAGLNRSAMVRIVRGEPGIYMIIAEFDPARKADLNDTLNKFMDSVQLASSDQR